MDMSIDDVSAAKLTTVRDASFEVLRMTGMTRIFSNPGSTEIPLLTNFPDEFDFILGLHEGSVVGMATGFAIATGSPQLVLLHTSAGLGNAAGAIATARVNRAPLVVLVGQQDRRHLVNRPFLAGELTGMVGNYPVWEGFPVLARDVPTLLLRAWHEANSRRGPAILIVPMDDWTNLADPRGLSAPSDLAIGDARSSVVTEVIDLLNSARNPAIVVGSDCDSHVAWEALVQLAELLQCPVWQESFGARAGFPQDHRLFAGHIPSDRARMRSVLRDNDVVLVVGAPAFRQYQYQDGGFVVEGTKILLITDNQELAIESVAERALVGSIPELVRAIVASVNRRIAASPVEQKSPQADGSSGVKLDVDRVLRKLAERLDPRTIVVEECPSARPMLHRYILVRRPLGFLSAAMGGLGFAMPASLGLRMADSERPVLAIVGDGSSMYSIQSLWSAANYGIGVLFVVLNNGSYAVMDRLAEAAGCSNPPWPALSNLDVAGVARGFGCGAEVVETNDQLMTALDNLIPTLAERTSPYLLEIRVGATTTFAP